MKENYIKPQIVVREIRINNYILNLSDHTEDGGMLKDMLSKDRNTSDEIWESTEDTESIW